MLISHKDMCWVFNGPSLFTLYIISVYLIIKPYNILYIKFKNMKIKIMQSYIRLQEYNLFRTYLYHNVRSL